jgi:regulator of protease activity HflC (stomatin/prohibitin superfamily)
MKDSDRLLSRGAIHSLTGFATCTVLASLLAWITWSKADTIAWHAFWPCVAATVVWSHLLISYLLLARESRHIVVLDGHEPINSNSTVNNSKHRNFLAYPFYFRFLLPLMELGTALLLAQSFRAGLSGLSFSTSTEVANNLLLVATYSITALLLIIFSVYVTGLMVVRTWHLLQAGRNINNLLAGLLVGLLAGACGNHFGFNKLSNIVGWGIVAINTLLAAEILLSMGLRLFSPRKPHALPRPAFDFYLLEGLSRPDRIGQTFTSMLEGFFGFDITRTSFGKVIQSLVLPTVSITIGSLLGLSSIVIVHHHEQAVVLNLGHLDPRLLQAGLHLKYPWPLSSVRRHNVGTVRSIHVGSHKPGPTGGSVYRKGVPILWTNMHGINIDELLICSSPLDRNHEIMDLQPSKKDIRKVPSVSLAGADVHIQYVIENLVDYLRTSAAPETLLRKVAETYATRLIYRYDIDALFTEARLELVDDIRHAVQNTCNKHKLGIKIVHVSLTAAHPPVQVADHFEATVVAMQEKETRIQQARQTAIRTKVETTGSVKGFDRQAAMVDQVDFQRGKAAEKDYDALLQDAGGAVSQRLAEAKSYRFTRENRERGTTDRFVQQLRAYETSPQNYRYDIYFSTIEKGLAKKRKVVFLGGTNKTIVRMGIEEKGMSMNLVTDEIGLE